MKLETILALHRNLIEKFNWNQPEKHPDKFPPTNDPKNFYLKMFS